MNLNYWIKTKEIGIYQQNKGHNSKTEKELMIKIELGPTLIAPHLMYKFQMNG
jgi:hypothetical protein